VDLPQVLSPRRALERLRSRGASAGSNDDARIPVTPAEIDAIRSRCKKLVSQRAFVSAGASVVPIPGVDLATDVGLLAELIPQINREFGLTPQQIDRLNPQRRVIVYRAVVAFGGAMVGRLVTRDMVLRALRAIGVRLTARQAARVVPVAGQAAAAALSYWAMVYVGEQHIRDCVRVVDALLEAEPV
jgi:uncharacterized protein (DUF697 family)